MQLFQRQPQILCHILRRITLFQLIFSAENIHPVIGGNFPVVKSQIDGLTVNGSQPVAQSGQNYERPAAIAEFHIIHGSILYNYLMFRSLVKQQRLPSAASMRQLFFDNSQAG